MSGDVWAIPENNGMFLVSQSWQRISGTVRTPTCANSCHDVLPVDEVYLNQNWPMKIYHAYLEALLEALMKNKESLQSEASDDNDNRDGLHRGHFGTEVTKIAKLLCEDRVSLRNLFLTKDNNLKAQSCQGKYYGTTTPSFGVIVFCVPYEPLL